MGRGKACRRTVRSMARASKRPMRMGKIRPSPFFSRRKMYCSSAVSRRTMRLSSHSCIDSDPTPRSRDMGCPKPLPKLRESLRNADRLDRL